MFLEYYHLVLLATYLTLQRISLAVNFRESSSLSYSLFPPYRVLFRLKSFILPISSIFMLQKLTLFAFPFNYFFRVFYLHECHLLLSILPPSSSSALLLSRCFPRKFPILSTIACFFLKRILRYSVFLFLVSRTFFLLFPRVIFFLKECYSLSRIYRLFFHIPPNF